MHWYGHWHTVPTCATLSGSQSISVCFLMCKIISFHLLNSQGCWEALSSWLWKCLQKYEGQQQIQGTGAVMKMMVTTTRENAGGNCTYFWNSDSVFVSFGNFLTSRTKILMKFLSTTLIVEWNMFSRTLFKRKFMACLFLCLLALSKVTKTWMQSAQLAVF